MVNLSSVIILLINSALFGLFTKLADLTDEHKKKFFKGDSLLFGFLWGIFGSLVIIGNPLLGSFYLAILFHWILRGKIDYLNHRIALLIILITFIYKFNIAKFDWYLFTITFIIYTVIGLLNDNKLIKKTWFTNLNIYSFIIIILFTLYNFKYVIVFYSYVLNSIFYQIPKKIYQKVNISR